MLIIFRTIHRYNITGVLIKLESLEKQIVLTVIELKNSKLPAVWIEGGLQCPPQS